MTENEAQKRLSAQLEATDIEEMLRNLNPTMKEQIAVLADLTAIFPPEKKAVTPPDDVRYVPFEIMQLDYMQTGEQIKMLTDIRFKLLAFVPPIVGGGIALLSSKAAITAGDQILTGSVGLLGFVLTLGIVLYDLRNSQLYNAHVHRAKVLERVLGCIRSGDERLWPTPSTGGGKAYGTLQASKSAKTGGVHTQRAIGLGSFFGQRIGHDPALSLVYGVALGAWIFPIVRGFSAGIVMASTEWSITNGNGVSTSVIALFASIISACIFVLRIKAHDRGWTATHLGYREAQEPKWAKGYHDTIANEEIEKKKKAEKRRAFIVTTRDKKPLSLKARVKFDFLTLFGKARINHTSSDKKRYVISSTNKVRQRMRIFEPMLAMEEDIDPNARMKS